MIFVRVTCGFLTPMQQPSLSRFSARVIVWGPISPSLRFLFLNLQTHLLVSIFYFNYMLQFDPLI